MSCERCTERREPSRVTIEFEFQGANSVRTQAMGQRCAACGEVFVGAEAMRDAERLAAVVALNGPVVTSEMMRFARRALDLSRQELAVKMRVSWFDVDNPRQNTAVVGLLRLLHEARR